MGKASIVIIENVTKQQFSRSMHCFIFSWVHQYSGGMWDTHTGMNEQNNWLIITKMKKKKILFPQSLSCNMFLYQF